MMTIFWSRCQGYPVVAGSDSRQDCRRTDLIFQRLKFLYLQYGSRSPTAQESLLTLPSDSPKNRRCVFVWLCGATIRDDSRDAGGSQNKIVDICVRNRLSPVRTPARLLPESVRQPDGPCDQLVLT